MSRNYRGDVDLTQIEKFMPLLVEKEDEGKISPILMQGDVSYIYIKHMNIFCKCYLKVFLGIKNIFSSFIVTKKC